jgi:hypothetical protein
MTLPNGNEDFQKPCLHLLLRHFNLNKSWKSLRYDNLDLRYKKVVFKRKVKHISSKSDEQAAEKKIIVLESF